LKRVPKVGRKRANSQLHGWTSIALAGGFVEG
jgi:hypothetical protein